MEHTLIPVFRRPHA